jgi:hypothetical protein
MTNTVDERSGSEQVKAYQENTATFRYIVEALGIDPRS